MISFELAMQIAKHFPDMKVDVLLSMPKERFRGWLHDYYVLFTD